MTSWAASSFKDGETTVDRHTDINLTFGWSTKARRQGRKFFERAHVTAKIDGVKILQADQFWARPVKLDDHYWATWWSYPAGRLSRGESMIVKFQLTLLQRVWDGTDWYEAGRPFDPGLECRVKAS